MFFYMPDKNAKIWLFIFTNVILIIIIDCFFASLSIHQNVERVLYDGDNIALA